jgi:ubiquinone/menaquinone biosynthesis C-methylase UbiE
VRVPPWVFGLGALPYDLSTRQRPWREHCAEMAAYFPPGPRTVLDLGCGPGVSAFAFADVGPGDRIVGLDVSQEMLRRARRQDRGGRCAWIRGDAHRLPIADASVDVVAGHSFLYLLPDRPRALREAHRVLRPGGRVVLLEPRYQGAAGDALSVLRMARRQGPFFAWVLSNWRWFAAWAGAFRPAEVTGLFREAGFAAPELVPTLAGLGWFIVAERPASGT